MYLLSDVSPLYSAYLITLEYVRNVANREKTVVISDWKNGLKSDKEIVSMLLYNS
jgi:hypothetical protein